MRRRRRQSGRSAMAIRRSPVTPTDEVSDVSSAEDDSSWGPHPSLFRLIGTANASAGRRPPSTLCDAVSRNFSNFEQNAMSQWPAMSLPGAQWVGNQVPFSIREELLPRTSGKPRAMDTPR